MGAAGGAPGWHRPLLSPVSPLRLKISHLDSIFLSRVAWANVGGLPGERGGWPGTAGAARYRFQVATPGVAALQAACWGVRGGLSCSGGERRSAIGAGALHVGLCGASSRRVGSAVHANTCGRGTGSPARMALPSCSFQSRRADQCCMASRELSLSQTRSSSKGPTKVSALLPSSKQGEITTDCV